MRNSEKLLPSSRRRPARSPLRPGQWPLPLLAALLPLLGACRGDDETLVPSTWTPVAAPASPDSVAGFYLLNEGNMGSNKSTLDFMDCSTGFYRKNIYAETNPAVPLELGDVGNDLQIYGDRLYAVVNCSNLVEVMDKRTARHIGSFAVANCRNIAFHEGYAYVSSYAGPVQLDPNARLGCVVKIDTATLQEAGRCTVGYQPEELCVSGGKLYVANSGGYRVPDYDRTVSVIDLATFAEERKIDVAVNLHRIRADRHGRLFVSSRGDYYGTGSDLYVIDTSLGRVTDTLHVAVSDFWIDDDRLYACATEYSYTGEQEWAVAYALIDTRTLQVVSRSFITDGTELGIRKPYGIAVNPETKEVYVADARDYVSPGTLYCFSPEGTKKWSVTTGDIPAHFAFLKTRNP